MRQYYSHTGQQQTGPFSFEDLKEQKIKPNTNIWFKGLDTWKPANEINELKELFSQAAPPPFIASPSHIEQNHSYSKGKRKSNTWMRLALVIIVIGAIYFYFQYQNSHPSGVTFKRASEDLNAGGKYSIGPFGMKATVNGFIRNSSSSTNYNDVTLEIVLYDKGGNEITKEFKTINDYFPAGSSKDFQLKLDLANGTKQLGWSVSSATAQ